MVLGTFFMTGLLPFLLVFVVMFAVLQKSKALGENIQVDAMVAFIIGLILIGFPQPRDIIVKLMPWIAVGIAAILVFMILFGFVSGDLSKAPKWMKVVFGILAGIYTIVVVLSVSGLWDYIKIWTENAGENNLLVGAVMIVLIVGAAILVVRGSKSPGGEKKKE